MARIDNDEIDLGGGVRPIGLPGGVQPIPERELRSPKMYTRIMTYLKLVNASRIIPLRMVQIDSGTRQVVNEIIETFILRLRESRSLNVMPYKLTVYNRGGGIHSTKVELTPIDLRPRY